MGYATVNKMQRVTPLLGKYNLTSNHFAVLHAIGLRENDERRAEVKAGKYKEYSPSGLRAWCFAGERRLAHDWSLSVKTVHRALAFLQEGGFIECRPHPNCRKAFFRRVNERKIDEMLQELPAFEAAYEKSLRQDTGDDDRAEEAEVADFGSDTAGTSRDEEAEEYDEGLDVEGEEYVEPDLGVDFMLHALGRPPEFLCRVPDWERQMAPINKKYGESNVFLAVSHALEPNDGIDFWLKKFRMQADPMKYLVKSIETIMGQGNAWRREVDAWWAEQKAARAEYLKTPAGLAETAEQERKEAAWAASRAEREALDPSEFDVADDEL